ncbi:hydroxyacylglutathione hydrolase [Celeribacter indicus]|uniref:Hydroxyacylglutathione hydrolase n=1 Tax=Celeribacter indicus TaxID=1208324 RepID=A0A0B5E7U4_9RHOB|nr:hydroxyacylglutathione hydrolase [Celeribacter indicus]AJE48367.1 hydroxyacylglutathione hydrolase [Celeribacter indicus]SDW73985.1 hydroxyacylglutathione hydrolase [Celeribacter indicus]
MLEIVTVPALEVFDNYYFLIRDTDTGKTAAVDCGGAAPVLAALEARGWDLDEIWITHHHWDHVGGVAGLKAETAARVRGTRHAAPNMPPLDEDLPQEGSFRFGAHEVQVLHVPGHANGHIAFYIPSADALFSGDSLMALGCGRLIEGTAEEMWTSLTRLRALPRETMVYSGHEYTLGNARFAATIEPGNAALKARIAEVESLRAEGKPTVPSSLGLECDTNPFLRADTASVKSALDMADAPDVAVFAEIRARKDRF